MIRFTGAQGAREVISFPLRLLAAIFVCSLSLSAALAQGNSALRESARAAQVRALNNSVLQLHGQVQENASSAGSVRGQAAQVLAQRAAALQALIQEDPRTALTFAFSPDLLGDLAAKFPDSANLLESQVTLSGTVEHWIADSADMKSSTESWFLNSSGSRLSLHFATPKFPNPKMTPVVTIEGVQVGSQVAVSKLSSAPEDGASIVIPQIANLLSGQRPVLLALLAMGLALMAAWKLTTRATLLGTSTLPRQVAVCALALFVAVCNPLVTSAQGTCSTTGVQNVAVLLVTFPGVALPAGVTTQSLQDVFFNTSTGISLDGFLRDASYGQTSATGGVFGPYTLTGTYASCTDVGGAVLNDAVAAAIASGANLHDYTRLVLVFPDIFNCGWQGYANVGSCSQVTSSGTFNLSVSYISAAYATPRFSGVQLASHEVGHNLGLLHSGLITPANASDVLGPAGSAGTEADLGDNWSTMGQINLGLYPSPQKAEVLGWMVPATNYQVVQSSGTYTLQPLETNPPGLQALKVQRGSGSNEWLWIEYRQPVGNYDSTLITEPYSGALIHYEDPNTAAGHTYLPNFTPSDTTGFGAALAAGRSWTDPYTNLTISVVSATSSGLTVSIAYGAMPCNSSAPSIVASPLNPSVYPGQTASYSVSVTNNDSTSCAPGAINLSSSEPAGWSTSFSSSSITLSPGQSATVTMAKGAPMGTPAGTYGVNLNAANNSASASDSANATVITPPSLAATVSVAGADFTPPASVPITASVTNGGAPAAGVSVKFTIAMPNGATTTQSATTGSNGTASWSYRLSQKSQPGAYTVTAQASLTSGGRKAAAVQSAISGSAVFTVQ